MKSRPTCTRRWDQAALAIAEKNWGESAGIIMTSGVLEKRSGADGPSADPRRKKWICTAASLALGFDTGNLRQTAASAAATANGIGWALEGRRCRMLDSAAARRIAARRCLRPRRSNCLWHTLPGLRSPTSTLAHSVDRSGGEALMQDDRAAPTATTIVSQARGLTATDAWQL